MPRRGPRVLREVREDLRRERTVDSVASVDALQPEQAQQQQAGGGKQHDGHRYLACDEHVLQAAARRSAAALRARLQRARNVDARAERGQHAEQHARDEGDG